MRALKSFWTHNSAHPFASHTSHLTNKACIGALDRLLLSSCATVYRPGTTDKVDKMSTENLIFKMSDFNQSGE